jgi:ABC-type uncharacterized transport system permease subunit
LLVSTVMAVAGAAMGALWIGLTGFPRARLGVNETVASLVLAYIGMAVFNHLVEGVFRDPASLSKPSTFGIGDAKTVAESRATFMAAQRRDRGAADFIGSGRDPGTRRPDRGDARRQGCA